ncbi:spore coat protein [Paenibacillus macerans]|uniref:spore coat protein n=1 Tax=Paenibacillus macerans TaxID=44252 RepID=UPI003D322193
MKTCFFLRKARFQVTPRTFVQQFNNREIATAYLLTLKRSGREYAWAATEMSNPGIDAFWKRCMCSHHAYDVWQWMVKGYYPLEPVAKTTLTILGKMYQLVQEPVAVQ